MFGSSSIETGWEVGTKKASAKGKSKFTTESATVEDINEEDEAEEEGVDDNEPEEEAQEQADDGEEKKTDDTVVEDLGKSFEKMTTAPFKRFSMAFQCPFILYDYGNDGRKVVSVDFLIPPVHRRHIRLKIREDGLALELGIVVPSVFSDPGRLMAAHDYKMGFNQNTHKATAFQFAARDIVKTCSNEFDEIIVGKQIVKLPFKCETEFYNGFLDYEADGGWEVQLFPHVDPILTAEIGEDGAEVFILSVDLVSVEQAPTPKTKGTMRRVAATAPADEGEGAGDMGDE
jgi:hypothetical protein